jgi:GNAT superfamily N-acetyltransferase
MFDRASNLVVREVRPRDTDDVADVVEAAFDEFRDAMGATLFAAYLADVLDVERRARNATVLVAEVDGSIVGTITLYANANEEGMPVRFPSGTAGIRATAVRPDARSRGVGSELVAASIERARAQGAKAIALHTAACMATATCLYTRHGFRRAPDLDFLANDFLSGGAGEPLAARAYVLRLGTAATTRAGGTSRPVTSSPCRGHPLRSRFRRTDHLRREAR